MTKEQKQVPISEQEPEVKTPQVEVPPFAEPPYDTSSQINKKGSGISGMLQPFILGLIAAAIVFMIGVPMIAPAKKAYQADITRLELDLVATRGQITDTTSLAAQVNGFSSQINNLASKTEVDALGSTVNTVSNKVTTLEDGIGDIPERLDMLEEEVANWEIPEAINGTIPLSYSISGTFGNYKLRVVSVSSGQFLAKVNIIYETPQDIGATGASINDVMKTFYNSWLTSPNREYRATFKWNESSSIWQVTGLSFYTNAFSLEAGIEKLLTIVFTGPVNTEHHSYAEVFSIIQVTSETPPDSDI